MFRSHFQMDRSSLTELQSDCLRYDLRQKIYFEQAFLEILFAMEQFADLIGHWEIVLEDRLDKL